MHTTEQMVATWSDRHTVAGPAWAPQYWADVDAPHRVALDRIWDRLVEAPQTVLELGCNAGPNLRRAAARWPSATLIGIDTNQTALDYLTRMAGLEGWGRRLFTIAADFRTMVPIFLAPVDLVVSCYALAYVAPADLRGVLDQLRRLTGRLGVVVEPMTTGSSHWLADVDPPGWAHDYAAHVETWGQPWGRSDLDGPDHLNGLIWWGGVA